MRPLVSLLLLPLLLSFPSPSQAAQRVFGKIEQSVFGTLPDGRNVTQYTLKNGHGIVVNVIDYGATVTSILAPDRNGRFSDIVLGYDSLGGYIADRSYFGCIVGRYGNRIGFGKFSLGGKEYQLSVNDGENHLHGGKSGFNKKLWKASASETSIGPSLQLIYVSPDGEEGYPGTLTITVTYTLTETDELQIEYRCTTDLTTIVNPTHHSYFNLTGDPTEKILGHILTLTADKFTPVDVTLIPTGVIADVAGTPMDFRDPTPIGDRINTPFTQLTYGRGYDHNWMLNEFTGNVRKVAEVFEPTSGRLLEVFTDQPGIQFYCGNFLDGTVIGKHGIAYQHRTGLCLEAQHFPDSPNKPQFPSVTLKPGQVYTQTTIYRFAVRAR